VLCLALADGACPEPCSFRALIPARLVSLQPKTAVEFDQAINYVNKIKVWEPAKPGLDPLGAWP
jgi:histone deacetylase complex regulatory component SIN3